MSFADYSADASVSASLSEFKQASEAIGSQKAFFFTKRLFDLVVGILLLPLLVFFAVVLSCLNPFTNAGPLFFIQTRMGRNCKAFRAIKFRTMRPANAILRGANDPLEHDRITFLGNVLRKTRIDELPQVVNVLLGDMSLIGPRPDYYEHACEFVASVPGYRERHLVRPGISGLAQTEVGYVEGSEATKKKVQADLYYILNCGFRLESWVFWRTLATIVGQRGS